MFHQIQHKNPGSDGAKFPAKFIAACVLAFLAGVLATAYFHHSMGYEMPMPGGWTMSMMWMRMPGETSFVSGINFLLMWLAMMVAMMMPGVLPMFIKTRRQWASHFYMASGYFAIWLAAGVAVYVAGMMFSAVAMQSPLFSSIVPVILSIWLIAAGAIQFTPWKITQLLRCRSTFGCSIACPENETSFQLGCKQGAACCVCCAAPMTIQLALGIMNPFVMIIVAIFIAAEKLLPRPEITARVVGVAAIFAGIITATHSDLLSGF